MFKKVFLLIEKRKKKQLFLIAIMVLIGVVLEMLSLGVMLPALTLLFDKSMLDNSAIRSYLDYFGNPSHQQVVIAGMLFLVFTYIFKVLFLLFLAWRQAKFSAELSADLSSKLFMGYLKQPYLFHIQRNSAQLMRNIQIEINQFTALTQAFINFATELSVVIGIAFMLFIFEPVGSLAVTSFLILFAILFHRITRRKLVLWGKQRQIHDGQINKHLLQGLGGIKEVKLMGRELFFHSNYTKYNLNKTKILIKQTTLQQFPRLYLELLAVIGLAGLIIIMIIQSKEFDNFVPTLGLFVAAAFRLIPSINRIMGTTQTIKYSQSVVETLYDEFQLINLEYNKHFQKSILNFNSNLIVDNVFFKYPNTQKYILNDINFSITKNKTIGFVGLSGAGKSTLVDLILGLLPTSKGVIKVDDVSISDCIRDWQNFIGYVPQSIYLTDDTLRNNIAFGVVEKDISESTINESLIAAQLEDFVNGLPEGLDTVVGERGIRLSGGQRQRIGIARALYHNPSILVLDEATSSLDTKTEESVMEAINAFQNKKTIIIVAHRLSTLSKCDLIYELKDGKVQNFCI
jgi:ABC-type multidrug transport system fused ATPase/permease subunit